MRTLNHLSSKTTCRVVGSAYDLASGSFPAVVRVETTNACNAQCIICPHSELKRPVRRMEETLFRRIIDECAAAGCKETHLHNFGEPLLDKDLERRVAYAKDQGLKKVKLFSNGSLLTPDRAKGLIEAGLDEIKISFDGATREEFEQIRTPLKFDRVVGNIRELVRLRDDMGSGLTIRVACCSTSDKERTMESLEQMVDGFSFGKIHNWAEGSSEDGDDRVRKPRVRKPRVRKPRVRKPCSRLWRTFTILASGDVSLCCLDYDGQVLLGRVDQQTSIRDIFGGAAYRKIRSRHREARQNEISLCRNCTKSFL